MPECLHESWICSESPVLDSSMHHCTDCHFRWLSNSEYALNVQIGSCDVCGKPEPDTAGFITKDSGQRESFGSGAVRDIQDGKPRYDLIPPKGLKRVAEVYARGSVKYGDSNWRKGMPSSRIMASLLRHVEAYRAGERDEDHIGQAIFNALALIEFEGTEWDDLSTMWSADE